MSPFQSKWQQVPRLKTRFPWEVGRRLNLLWRHSFVTWLDPAIFYQVLRKGCPISYAKFQRIPTGGSAVISENALGVHPPPPAPAKVNARILRKGNQRLVFWRRPCHIQNCLLHMNILQLSEIMQQMHVNCISINGKDTAYSDVLGLIDDKSNALYWWRPFEETWHWIFKA